MKTRRNDSNHRAFIAKTDGEYLAEIRNGLDWIHFETLAKPHKTIFIKPNLTFPFYRKGVMTNPAAVEAAIIAIKDYTPNIIIGDADSGGYNPFSMDDVYTKTGLVDIAKRHDVRIVNLSKIPRRQVAYTFRGRNYTISLPKLLTDEVDLLVTMPVPKVHANTGVSLTFKNQWGCIPEPADRLRLHPTFRHVIQVVNDSIHAQVAIIDGMYGLNGNGPMRGDVVELNWVLVANSLGSGARVACALMQVDPRRIRHLRYAQKLGKLPELDAVTLNTDWRPFLGPKFVLQRKWTDYPGYCTFHSKSLAYIGYFSPFAKMLHRMLYLVREPFY